MTYFGLVSFRLEYEIIDNCKEYSVSKVTGFTILTIISD